jgi:tetratricopeptide (TPR) repeat protein
VTVGHGRIGSLLLAERDVAGALIELRAAVAGSEALVARDPTNTAWQTELAVAHRKLGEALQAGRDFKAALVQHRAALAIAQTLAAKDPSNRDWERELAVGHDKLGNVFDAMHDAKAALAEYRMFEVEMTALAEKDPKNRSAQRDLAIAHGKVADALKAHGDVTGSLAAYRAYLAIAETLAEATTPSWQTDIASTLAAKDPTNVALQQDVAVRHEQLGDALLASKDAAGGVAEYRTGLAIVRRLEGKDPKNVDVHGLVTELAAKAAKGK